MLAISYGEKEKNHESDAGQMLCFAVNKGARSRWARRPPLSRPSAKHDTALKSDPSAQTSAAGATPALICRDHRERGGRMEVERGRCGMRRDAYSR